MAHSLIKGPEDYKLFFHTDGEGNIWLDGKRNPISRDNPLTETQVDSIYPLDLWHGRNARSKIHSTEAPTQRGGVINSTAVTHNLPPPNLPFSPIKQSDHSEKITRDLRSDPTIANHLLDEALSKLSSDSDHQRSDLNPQPLPLTQILIIL